MILGFIVSCLWANKPGEKPIRINIAIFRLISGKDRKKSFAPYGALRVGGPISSGGVAPP